MEWKSISKRTQLHFPEAGIEEGIIPENGKTLFRSAHKLRIRCTYLAKLSRPTPLLSPHFYGKFSVVNWWHMLTFWEWIFALHEEGERVNVKNFAAISFEKVKGGERGIWVSSVVWFTGLWCSVGVTWSTSWYTPKVSKPESCFLPVPRPPFKSFVRLRSNNFHTITLCYERHYMTKRR